MASRATVEKWLGELTNVPTASGLEAGVVGWVTRWVARRPDLNLETDSGGNLLITQRGRKSLSPVVAVAHMDHPAFVITDADNLAFEFRGGVDAPYFEDARVALTRTGERLVVDSYDPGTSTGTLRPLGRVNARVDDIGMWVFPKPLSEPGVFHAPACDDLAGVVASLAALDLARKRPGMRHYGVLLTRAEEVGLVGALHAAKHRTVPPDSRILSIETSRELATAPLGEGPIIRTGDRATVFDRDLTNAISHAAAAAGLTHQRKLMDGGGCEATAFGGFGYQATGLCVALRNWHNRGNLDQVQAGTGEAVPMLEAIALDDFHGLIELILLSVFAADTEDPLRSRMEALYRSQRHIL